MIHQELSRRDRPAKERRLFTRKTLNPMPYINLPSGNGGVVLDISEQGLRFRAVSPIEPSGPILFWFTAHSSLIAGVAELAWTDPDKKTGGLRFTQMPYNASELIRSWPRGANSPLPFPEESSDDDSPRPVQAADDSEDAGVSTLLKCQAVINLDSLQSAPFATVLQETGSADARDYSAAGHPPTFMQYEEPQSRGWLLTACALGLAIALSTWTYFHRREAGKSLVWLGTQISGEAATPAPPALPSPPPDPSEGFVFPLPLPPAPITFQSLTATPKSGLSGTKSVPIPSGKHVVDARQTEARSEAAGASSTAPRRTANSRNYLFVQVAASRDEAEARKLAEGLRVENRQAFVHESPGDAYHRVLLGPYLTPAAARAAIEKLKKAGFNAFPRREALSAMSSVPNIAEVRPTSANHATIDTR